MTAFGAAPVDRMAQSTHAGRSGREATRAGAPGSGGFRSRARPVALDLLELTELAWHDCYGETTPSEDVIEDMLLLSQGNIERLIRAARLAVADRRDLRVAAEELRRR
jgi:hypothetical protein